MDTIPSTHPHIAPRCYPSVDGLSHTRMGGTGVFSRPFSRVDGELPITSCTTYSQRDGCWNIWQYYEATKLWIKVSMEWIVKRLIRLTLKWVITGNPTEKKSSFNSSIYTWQWEFPPFPKVFSFLLQLSEFVLPIWSLPKTGSANCLSFAWMDIFYTGEIIRYAVIKKLRDYLEIFSKRTQILFQYSEDDFETEENIVGMVDKWKQ